MSRRAGACGWRRCLTKNESQSCAEGDHNELCIDSRQDAEHRDGNECDGGPAMVWTQLPGHVPYCLGNDGDGDEFEAMNQSTTYRSAQACGNGCEGKQEQDGRQCEPTPGSEPTQPPCPKKADRESHLATRGAWKELTKPDQIGKRLVIQPAAPLNEFAAKIPNMRNGTTKACQPQPEKDCKNFRRGADSDWMR